MRVGLTMETPSKVESLRQVARGLREALADRHELIYWPAEAAYHTGESHRSVVDDFVRRCDVVVGYVDDAFLAARRRLRSNVPCVVHLLGGLPRGAFGWRYLFPQLTTGDVLVANSTADVALAAQFLCNAQVQLVPFAFDDRAYYPLGDGERRALRSRLGFQDEDRVLLYAGRITLEKNVHTLLRVFRAVLDLNPHAHLVIAGRVDEVPFSEFGVVPVDLLNTLKRAVAKLGFPDGRVHLAGPTDTAQLRALYNIAEAVINLTLNHDENFGLAQVEAMACGTPVIGTAWGGLRDTIIDGVTGYKVTTLPTLSGVKVNWFEAANRVAVLLDDPTARARFRESCSRHVTEHYSRAAYQGHIESVVTGAAAAVGNRVEPLQPTEWAAEFWSVCDPLSSAQPPYRRGPKSAELYRQLIVPYTGASTESVPVTERVEPDDVVCLSTPIVAGADGRLRFDDPLYPFELDLPDAHRSHVGAILAAMQDEPVTTADRLLRGCAQDPDRAVQALAWLLTVGALLRTRPTAGWPSARQVSGRVASGLFSFVEIDRAATDFILFRA